MKLAPPVRPTGPDPGLPARDSDSAAKPHADRVTQLEGEPGSAKRATPPRGTGSS